MHGVGSELQPYVPNFQCKHTGAFAKHLNKEQSKEIAWCQKTSNAQTSAASDMAQHFFLRAACFPALLSRIAADLIRLLSETVEGKAIK